MPVFFCNTIFGKNPFLIYISRKTKIKTVFRGEDI